MQQKPRHILAYAAEFCKGFRATQRRNFSLLCWAIFRKRTTVLSELARCFSRPRRHIHRLKRLWRFVSNAPFDFRAAMDALCWSACLRPSNQAPAVRRPPWAAAGNRKLFIALKAGAFVCGGLWELRRARGPQSWRPQSCPG